MSKSETRSAAPLVMRPVVRWRDGERRDDTVAVIDEVPVAVVFNQVTHAVMMATPIDLAEFALGFALTEELLDEAAQLQDVQIVPQAAGIELHCTVPVDVGARIAQRTRRLAGRTGCGLCGAESFAAALKSARAVPAGVTIRRTALAAAFAALQTQQPLNAAAGAVHAAGFATADGVLQLVREDVGRHNALDKLVGAVVRAGLDPATGFVCVTSRASFEMVQKTVVLGAPLLAAISGPTGLAVRTAEAAGLTLAGFVRGTGLTVYAGAARLAE